MSKTSKFTQAMAQHLGIDLKGVLRIDLEERAMELPRLTVEFYLTPESLDTVITAMREVTGNE